MMCTPEWIVEPVPIVTSSPSRGIGMDIDIRPSTAVRLIAAAG